MLGWAGLVELCGLLQFQRVLAAAPSGCASERASASVRSQAVGAISGRGAGLAGGALEAQQARDTRAAIVGQAAVGAVGGRGAGLAGGALEAGEAAIGGAGAVIGGAGAAIGGQAAVGAVGGRGASLGGRWRGPAGTGRRCRPQSTPCRRRGRGWCTAVANGGVLVGKRAGGLGAVECPCAAPPAQPAAAVRHPGHRRTPLFLPARQSCKCTSPDSVSASTTIVLKDAASALGPHRPPAAAAADLLRRRALGRRGLSRRAALLPVAGGGCGCGRAAAQQLRIRLQLLARLAHSGAALGGGRVVEGRAAAAAAAAHHLACGGARGVRGTENVGQ